MVKMPRYIGLPLETLGEKAAAAMLPVKIPEDYSRDADSATRWLEQHHSDYVLYCRVVQRLVGTFHHDK